MTYTVIINIAGAGTPLANGDASQVGHMRDNRGHER